MKRRRLIVFLLFFISSLIIYFYKFKTLLTFDADQEYYAYQYIQIVTNHKPTLLGIETSIGGMFVGPLYTYFSTFIYWLSHGDPIGISLVTLFLASFQAGLTYWFFTLLKKESVGVIAGLLTLFSFSLWSKAFSPSVINFLFLFGLLFLFCLSRVIYKKKYILWLSLLLGVSLHVHVSLWLFFPIVLIFFIWRHIINKNNITELIFGSLIILLFSFPLLLFDIRHNFLISKNLTQFIGKSFLNNSSGNNVFAHALSVFISLINVLANYLSVNPNKLVYGLLCAILLFFMTKATKDHVMQISALIFAVTIFFFTFYNGPLPDYYLYMLLAPFIYITALFIIEIGKYKIISIPLCIFLIILLIQNIRAMDSAVNPYNLYRKWDAVKYIKSQSRDKPVKVAYDTDLGLGFGFNYLLDYEKVKKEEINYQDIYQIVIRKDNSQPGVEFGEPNSLELIKVVRLF